MSDCVDGSWTQELEKDLGEALDLLDQVAQGQDVRDRAAQFLNKRPRRFERLQQAATRSRP
ncbi:hypothetical protein GCM10011581_43350 [Saccharopolyspora subtropica]|uniref:Uncharacterized protein n=1 Tax=Saccharopolyspora thermophila TaxID=89367 RepID=A0A917K670_9PSEU|nr:hypothetical protein [Saccharopolyspora subtropica]GGJ01474.1 hypothetical protein GCM10011581_43350 [Saccharopolyspora subtropica]